MCWFNLLSIPLTVVALVVFRRLTGSWLIAAAIIAAFTLLNFYGGNSHHHPRRLHSFYEADANRRKVITYYDGANNYTHQPAGWV